MSNNNTIETKADSWLSCSKFWRDGLYYKPCSTWWYTQHCKMDLHLELLVYHSTRVTPRFGQLTFPSKVSGGFKIVAQRLKCPMLHPILWLLQSNHRLQMQRVTLKILGTIDRTDLEWHKWKLAHIRFRHRLRTHLFSYSQKDTKTEYKILRISILFVWSRADELSQ